MENWVCAVANHINSLVKIFIAAHPRQLHRRDNFCISIDLRTQMKTTAIVARQVH